MAWQKIKEIKISEDNKEYYASSFKHSLDSIIEYDNSIFALVTVNKELDDYYEKTNKIVKIFGDSLKNLEPCMPNKPLDEYCSEDIDNKKIIFKVFNNELYCLIKNPYKSFSYGTTYYQTNGVCFFRLFKYIDDRSEWEEVITINEEQLFKDNYFMHTSYKRQYTFALFEKNNELYLIIHLKNDTSSTVECTFNYFIFKINTELKNYNLIKNFKNNEVSLVDNQFLKMQDDNFFIDIYEKDDENNRIFFFNSDNFEFYTILLNTDILKGNNYSLVKNNKIYIFNTSGCFVIYKNNDNFKIQQISKDEYRFNKNKYYFLKKEKIYLLEYDSDNYYTDKDTNLRCWFLKLFQFKINPFDETLDKRIKIEKKNLDKIAEATSWLFKKDKQYTLDEIVHDIRYEKLPDQFNFGISLNGLEGTPLGSGHPCATNRIGYYVKDPMIKNVYLKTDEKTGYYIIEKIEFWNDGKEYLF